MFEDKFQKALQDLGLDKVPYEEISSKRISSAFRARVFVVHPDRRDGQKNQEHTRILTEAKATLLSFLQEEGEENFGFLNRPKNQIIPDREYLHEDILELLTLILMHGDVTWMIRSKLQMPELPNRLYNVDENLNVQYTYPSWVPGAFEDLVPSVSADFLEVLRLLTVIPPSQVLHIRMPKRAGMPTKHTQIWILWHAGNEYNSVSMYVKKTA